MSTKAPASLRSRLSASLVGAFKGVSDGVSEHAVIEGGFGLFIIVALSILMLRDYQRPRVEQLSVGSVATSDIIAPSDLKVEDPGETKRLRDQAAASVMPVFDFNVRSAVEATRSLEQLFNTAREAPPNATVEELHERIEESVGIPLDPDQIKLLAKHRFSPDLERLMVDHIETAMMTPIVASRSQFRRLGATAIAKRDLRNNQEVIITDLSSVRDKLTASAALRSEKLIWPAEYSLEARKTLGEILGSLVVPNLEYNEAETENRRTEMREGVPVVKMTVERGKPIVASGETVTPAKAMLLAEAARQRPIGQRAIEFLGTVVIVMLLLLVLWQYMVRYQHQHLRVRRHFLLQIACFVVTLGLARLFFTFAAAMSQWSTHTPFNSPTGYRYLAPLAVGAVLVTILTDANAAFIFSAILSVFVGVFSGSVHLAAFTLMSSAGAIYHLHNCRDRTALVAAGLWIGALNAATTLALDLLGANEPDLRLLLFDSFCGYVGGVLATMAASILLPLFEWLFEITTSIKLLELSNLNLPLLKQLAERAPGTYHHSIMVGLLAEAGAEAIGADALFARVACYYHDIGKTVRPGYFVENQSYMDNRHDKLSPKMSSIVLANHVKQGIEIARKYKLPPRIVAIIPQHHGTGLMKFFYYKARKSNDDESNALEQEFRYPGPKPKTKEAAIIMIADSAEAAARTVAEPTPTKLRNMIDMIITRLRDDGQFDDCSITLRDLRIVAESFVKVLMGIHHHRIAYPGYDFNQLSRVSPAVEAFDSGGHPSLAASAKPSASSKLREARGD
ncbi:MAG TPA: HDIG domain-containing protein [Blastocatellia bacterium]|nr:HDIG domain-containing protein [Blastocatellia bacterium]